MSVIALALLLTGLIRQSGYHNQLYKPTDLPHNATTDNNLSFLNGLSLGIVIAIFMIIPEFEKQSLAFRILCFTLLADALGRIVSVIKAGLPVYSHFILIEIVVPLIVMYWQRQMAKRT